MAVHSYSIVVYRAEQEKSRCGYCKGTNTSFSHGIWAHLLTVQDYQGLIDRGWRRSGCYCYKPTMDRTCCPLYTIKCEVLDFKISKSQKKILKRMTKFLKNELKKDDIMDTSGEDRNDYIDISTGEIPNYEKHLLKAQQNADKMNVSSVDAELNGRLHLDTSSKEQKSCDQNAEQKSSKHSSPVENHSKNLPVASHSRNAIETNISQIPCKKAKLLRKERKQNKLLAQGKSQKEIDDIFREHKQENHVKSVEELFDEVITCTNRLELKLVRASSVSSGYENTSKKSYEVYKKYQTTIHGVPEEKVTEKQYKRFLEKSPLQMKLVRVMSDEFLNTLDTSANLYKKYQMGIHGDPAEECDKSSFFAFLVKSPLQPWTPNDGPPHGYGSFHDQYWLDNELIAVGVLDILPSCVSSVYFFYDPAYSHLSLGTLSSLREVYLTRQLNKTAKDLKYYYMGFYIHTCPKMRYKARMRPSKLLCPESYQWIDIDPCLEKLDKEKYCRLNDDIDAIDTDANVNISKVLVMFHQVAMSYKIYKKQYHRHISKEEEEEVKEYASLVGMKCAQSMLLYRN